MRRSSATLPGTPQPTADYLTEVMGALWPAAQMSARGRRIPGGAGRTEFVAVPTAGRPKVVVPRRPLPVAAAALRNSRSTSSSLMATMLRGIALAARLGAVDLLPDRIVVTRSDAEADIVSHLRCQLGEPVLVSLLIGPVRATQKPVLQVLSPDARVIGFAKLGLNELSRGLVRREAEALTLLETQGLRSVRVPTVLHRGSWRGHEVLVQEAFPQNRGGAVDPRRLTAAMIEVARSCGVDHVALVDSVFWRELRDRLRLLDGTTAQIVTTAMHRLESECGRTSLGFGAWHGDWAPWNMVAVGDEVCVWDWETFARGLPLGFDRIHYGLQADVVLHDVPPAGAVVVAANRAAAELSPFGVDPAVRRLTVVLYLLHLVAGFAQAGEKGTRLARLDTWIPTTLPRLVDEAVAEATR